MRIDRRRFLSLFLAGTAGAALPPAALGQARRALAAGDRRLRVAGSPLGDPGAWDAFTKRTGWTVESLAISDDSATIRSLLLAEAGEEGTLDLLHAVGGMNRTLITNQLVDPIEIERLKAWSDNDYIQTFFASEDAGFPYIGENGRVYAVPTVLQGDSFAYLPEVTGKLNSLGALFDPEWKGRVALQDNVWSAGLKTALYLKESGRAAIVDPGNMTPGEIRLVIDYLIDRKNEGQFLALWTSSEEATRLIASKEAVIVDCGEDIVAAASAQGVNAVYAAPVEGYLLWTLSASIVHNPSRGAAATQAVYDLIDFMLDGWYGATIGLSKGLMTNPRALAFVEENSDDFSVDEQVKIQALDSAGRLKFQKGGVWSHRWPEDRQAFVDEWERFKAA